jgi:arginine decarboxylase
MSDISELLIGNRIPKDFFIATGTGESDIIDHAGSYHLALHKAGIEMCNIMTYSSILPKIATQTKKPKNLVHGSVMETIMAVHNYDREKDKLADTVTAGVIFGWLQERKTGKRYGGLVCEYHGTDTEEVAKKQLGLMLQELYTNGYEHFDLKGERIIIESFKPNKRYGTALVALCFTNYVVPILDSKTGEVKQEVLVGCSSRAQ